MGLRRASAARGRCHRRFRSRGFALIRMAKALSRNRSGSRQGSTKYDAHQKVLSQTYGALADLRRELSDSKSAVAEREEILRNFSGCADSQRAWLLLEDYFEKLSLSRKDFPAPAG